MKYNVTITVAGVTREEEVHADIAALLVLNASGRANQDLDALEAAKMQHHLIHKWDDSGHVRIEMPDGSVTVEEIEK